MSSLINISIGKKKNIIKNSKKFGQKQPFVNQFILLFAFLFIIILLISLFSFFKIFKIKKYKTDILIQNSNKINSTVNELNIIPFSDLLIFFEKRMNELRRSSIEWPIPKEVIFKPYMYDNELREFSYFMKSSNIYFEFGSGGSTNLASYYKVKTYSVESDINWHNKIKLNNISAIYITIDLKTKDLGYPGKDTTVDDWKKYIQAYKNEYNADIILIDGRFRVACALDIFSKIGKDTLVLIHDYDREYYHIIENYYIKVKTWERLSAFFKNPNITDIPKEIYDKYIFIPE